MSEAENGLLLQQLRAEYRHLLTACVDKLEHCVVQLSDEQLCQRPGPGQNSIANQLAHMTGNLRQWALAGFGEEADLRKRESEFRDFHPCDRKLILQELISVLSSAASVIQKVNHQELAQVRTIQGFEVTGLQALSHTVTHFVGHTHQVVQLTRWLLGSDYQFHGDHNTARFGVPI